MRLPAVLLATFLAATAMAAPATFKAGTFEPAMPAPDFVLQGSSGQPVQLSALRGKVVVLGFGFSSCAEVCPVTLGTLAQARRKLGEAGKDVQVVYVTVDHERDVPARMKQYLAGFDAGFIGGSGTAAQLEAVRHLYGVTAEKRVFGDDYLYAHSSSTFLIDRQGRLRAFMPYGHGPDDYVNDLSILLQERP